MKISMLVLLTAVSTGPLLGCGKGDDTGGEGAAGPELATSHDAMDFGTQPYGVASAQSLTVANVGEEVLSLESVVATEPWAIDEEVPSELEPGASIGLTVSFIAGSRGANEGEVTILSDDPTRPELIIPLSATVDTPPEVLLNLDPPEAFTDTVLEAAVAVTGEERYLDLSYSWQVNDLQVSGAEGPQLDGLDHFDKGDVVRVTVTPLVGVVYLDALSAELTVKNSPPQAPKITWSSLSPQPGTDDLQCVIDEEATDADPEDADALVYQFVWQVDGEDYLDAIATDLPGDTVPTEDLGRSQEWTCTVTATDGDGAETEPVTIALETQGVP